MATTEFPKGYFSESYTSHMPTAAELDRDLAPFKSTLVAFVKGLPENAKLLDAGCGVGKAIKTVRAYRPDVEISAMDISDVAAYLPEHVKFQVASVEQIGDIYAENSFDAIICQHVIEHLIYPMDMMQNFKKVLKPDGRLFLETPNWSRALIPFSPTYFWNDYTHIRIFTKNTMRKLMHDFNFDILSIKTVSSSEVVVRDDSVKKIGKVFNKGGRSVMAFIRKVILTIFLRITNPFLFDILIVVATNKK
jgi:2-polyprenyl-3-methyl-5-hydroxy-6-metoxy-1,4-benzoquinol methylase